MTCRTHSRGVCYRGVWEVGEGEGAWGLGRRVGRAFFPRPGAFRREIEGPVPLRALRSLRLQRPAARRWAHQGLVWCVSACVLYSERTRRLDCFF